MIWLRLPGHGTCPSALAKVSSDDWTTAVKVAARGLRDRLPPDVPLILGGYSNGGALSVHYALASHGDETLPKPSAVVLFSPMIGINPLARITRLYHVVALLFRNSKAQWSNIDAEIDPFKYSSWPMNASVQAWKVTQAVERQLASLEKAGALEPITPRAGIAIDSRLHRRRQQADLRIVRQITVEVRRVVSGRHQSSGQARKFIQFIVRENHYPKFAKPGPRYKLSVLSNASPTSRQIVLQTRTEQGMTETDTQLFWPDEVVSLSHIALPFPPDDPVYGTSQATAQSGLPLGSLSMRAEPSLLLISSALFVRCRHNPFYGYMEDHIVQWLASVISSNSCNQVRRIQG